MAINTGPAPAPVDDALRLSENVVIEYSRYLCSECGAKKQHVVAVATAVVNSEDLFIRGIALDEDGAGRTLATLCARCDRPAQPKRGGVQ